MKRVPILGVPIDDLTQEEAFSQILTLARGETRHHIMTPNPEMLVAAHRDSSFHALLNKTALNLPDGTGLLWAARRKKQPLRERVTGTDMLIALSKQSEASMFFLGAAPGVADTAKHRLREKNPNLKVVGTFSGTPVRGEEDEIVERINASGAKILFVAYGAPMQDIWIDRVLPKLTHVKVAMGVGGAFDFIAGKQKRAPEWMRKAGLEWLWRLFREPKRYKRILNAVVVFPYLVLRFD